MTIVYIFINKKSLVYENIKAKIKEKIVWSFVKTPNYFCMNTIYKNLLHI